MKETKKNMVTLINILKISDILSADYYPEGNKNDVGHIEYDLKNQKLIKTNYCTADKNSFFNPYLSKALLAIKEMATKHDFPSTYDYMWY